MAEAMNDDVLPMGGDEIGQAESSEPVSLDDALAQSYDEAASREEAHEDGDGTLRSADGRFVARDGSQRQREEEHDELDSEFDQYDEDGEYQDDLDGLEDGTEPGESAAGEAGALPPGWSDGMQEVWSVLPPEIQDVVRDRESQRDRFLQSKVQEVAQQSRELDRYGQVLSENQQALAAMGGGDPLAGIQKGVRANETLTRIMADPGAFVDYLERSGKLPARGAQADPDDLGASSQPSAETVQLRRELQAIKGHLTRQQQEGQRQQEEHLFASNLNAVDQFSDELDENGNPAHPYMGDPRVAEEMIAALEAGHDLHAAYARAVKLTGVDAEQRREQAKLERARRAAQARRRPGRPPRSSGRGTVQDAANPSTSLDETLSAAFDKAMAG